MSETYYVEDTEGPDGEDGQSDRSRIRFPYNDLASAVGVAMGVGRYGRECDHGQLTAALNLSPNSGPFRQRLSAATMFGVIEQRRGTVSLTGLGRRIIDPQTEATARVEAFLGIPLYEQIFSAYNGALLPADEGLEAEMVRLGVPPKQVGKARQAFRRSAEQAGFFAASPGRLVRPATATVEVAVEPPPRDPADGQSKGDVMSDVLLVGLLKRMLPAEGEPFTAHQRTRFFRALAVNLDVIYGEPDDGTFDPEQVAKLYKGNDGRVTAGVPSS